MAQPSACLILPCGADPWHRENIGDGFRAVAAALAAEGWNVRLLEWNPGTPMPSRSGQAAAGVQYSGIGPVGTPVFAGPGPASMTESWRAGYAIAQALRGQEPDLILAPLREGIAQPLLMARAAGEAFRNTLVIIWGDAPTRWRILNDDGAIGDPGPLVADALERSVLRLADAVIVADPAAEKRLSGVALEQTCFHHLPLPIPQTSAAPPAPAAPLREIVFVGPADRVHGLPEFLDAVESLAEAGRLGRIAVSFLGPMREQARGMSKAMLGVRAQSWGFDFKVIDAQTPASAAEYLRKPGLLPVFAGEPGDDDDLSAMLADAGSLLLASARRLHAASLLEPACVYDAGAESLAAGIARLLDQAVPRVPRPSGNRTGTGWPTLLGRLHASPRRAPAISQSAPPKLSVCIIHRDRPELLRQALTSILAGGAESPEILVLDNASRSQGHQAVLAWMAEHHSAHCRLIELDQHLSLPAARNRAAAASSGEIIVFLDDDNVIAPGGLSRFIEALRHGRFDIAASCLDLFDSGNFSKSPGQRLLFLGDAASAGLMFNCFGDSNMAVTRDAFMRVGGFEETSGASDDWVFLAKARARGLRIGVIQEPAICYAQDHAAVDRKWRKLDQEGGRAAVLRAYAGMFDGELLARLVQGLTLWLM